MHTTCIYSILENEERASDKEDAVSRRQNRETRDADVQRTGKKYDISENRGGSRGRANEEEKKCRHPPSKNYTRASLEEVLA